MQFYTGLHQPSDAHRFSYCFISISRLRERVGGFKAQHWILDSGAFTELEHHRRYRQSPEAYAAQINRWEWNQTMDAAISQDYMCERYILDKTGLSIPDHQRLTIERYDAIRSCVRHAYVMPVLQGYQPQEYVAHIRAYGDRLPLDAWVGVGSVCKRNGDPAAIVAVLKAILAERKDLRLHGFGIKTTSLAVPEIAAMLHSADSLAWSRAARWNGSGANDWRNARRFTDRINQLIGGV